MKILKVVGIVLGVVALGVGGFAGYVATDWPVRKPLAKLELKVEATPERLARGQKLVSLRCAGCHYSQATGALSGTEMKDTPPEFGRIFSHNITAHPTKGLGRYSDGELAVLLRTGVRRDGVFTGPFMQSPHLADEDVASIIAFLRSDHPWVKPVDVDDRQWEATFLAKLLMHVAFKPLELPKEKIVAPQESDTLALGRYVAHAVGDCFACHSKDFKTMNVMEPERSEGYLGGGNAMRDAAGNPIDSANLTMDRTTGIGDWTEEQFVSTLRSGVRHDGRALRYPMTPFGELSETEAKAVFAYLKTVPVLVNVVNRRFDTLVAKSDGEQLYNKYACNSCHGATGDGLCTLLNASKVYDTDEKLVAFVRDASKFVPGTKMPTWNGVIPEAEYGPLIAHVRGLEKAAAK